jgi:CcmD family protein
MKNFTRYIFALIFLLSSSLAKAQQVEMADGLRAEGKIYVVVLIILIVLFGLVGYLFLMDRKLNRLEKMLNEKQQTKR